MTPDEMADLEFEAGFTQEVDEQLSGGGTIKRQNVLKPSQKSPGMEKFLESISGRTSAIETLKCIRKPLGCGRDIDPNELESWDELTRREYTISGMCKTCQDEVFSGEED